MKRYPVDPADAIDEVTELLSEHQSDTGIDGYILGLSGGIDSAVTSAIAAEAINGDNITALLMPGEPTLQSSVNDAEKHADDFDLNHEVIDIESIAQMFSDAPSEPPRDKVTMGNTRARTRMVLVYQFANQHNMHVLGTGNRTEYLLGYFTKHGDGAADIKPILGLYKTEIKEIAKNLGVDKNIIDKPPSAGLWEGQTDEEELGASYHEIDLFLHNLVDKEEKTSISAEKAGLDTDTAANLEAMLHKSKHKREPASTVDFNRKTP